MNYKLGVMNGAKRRNPSLRGAKRRSNLMNGAVQLSVTKLIVFIAVIECLDVYKQSPVTLGLSEYLG